MIATTDDADHGDRDEQAAYWCMMLADDDLAAQDRIVFDAWVADARNQQAFEEACAIWGIADQAAGKAEVIHHRARALRAYQDNNARRWTRRQVGWKTWGAIAAGLALLVTGSFWLLKASPTTYETGVGERQVVMLTDGSRLSLDGASRVDVEMSRNHRDLTLLAGRAKFDVAKDPLRPFRVTVGDKMVVATGTSFSVETLRNQLRVLLYEGHVAVLTTDPSHMVREVSLKRVQGASADQSLQPGKELVAALDGNEAEVIPVDAAHSLGWEAGELSFDEVPLASAIERMNRYSQRRLIVQDPGVAQLHISGLFTASDTAGFLEGLNQLYGIRAVAQENGAILLKRA